MSDSITRGASKAFVDGWRGRIGLVASAPGNATEADFNRYRPGGVAVLTTRTPLLGSTVEGIRCMNEYVEQAVSMLAQNCFCDLIFLSSTAGSFVRGAAADRQYTQDLTERAGVRVLSSSLCLLKACEALGVSRLTLITPSSSDLNEAERLYLRESGLEPVSEGGFYLSSPGDILRTDPKEVYELVRRADSEKAEAVFISCSGLHVTELLETLETDLGKPVIASNQLGLWGCLRALGLGDEVKGAGSLFRR